MTDEHIEQPTQEPLPESLPEPVKEHSDDTPAPAPTVVLHAIEACRYVGKEPGLVAIADYPIRPQEIVLAPADVIAHLTSRVDFKRVDDQAAIAKARLEGMLFTHPYALESR